MVHQLGKLLCLQLTSELGFLGTVRVLDITGHIDEAGATERERNDSVEEPVAEIGCHAPDIPLNLRLQVNHLLNRAKIWRIGLRAVRFTTTTALAEGIFGLATLRLPTTSSNSFLQQTRHIE